MDNSFKKMFGGTAGVLIAISVVCCVIPILLGALNMIVSGGR